MSKIRVIPFFHEATNTVTYIVIDPATACCVIIDPVMDYDSASGTLSHTFADTIVNYIDKNGLKVERILETHAHADHVTAAPYLREKVGGLIGIGEHICRVQSTFKKIFHLGEDFVSDGSQFDQLFSDGEIISLGHLSIEVLHTPGHTPACVSYLIDDAVFVGDTLFMPDFGTARADFPDGNAQALFQSIKKLLALPNHTRIFVGHDYKAPGRDEFAWETSVIAQRKANVHVKDGITQKEFVTMREQRDAGLAVPKLLLPSIQINIRAGQLPPAEDNHRHYLKIPLTVA
jgi:glyoxylase-like metal-dependent hydrolase (beta-lactamase superfamily II)